MQRQPVGKGGKEKERWEEGRQNWRLNVGSKDERGRQRDRAERKTGSNQEKKLNRWARLWGRRIAGCGELLPPQQ